MSSDCQPFSGTISSLICKSNVNIWCHHDYVLLSKVNETQVSCGILPSVPSNATLKNWAQLSFWYFAVVLIKTVLYFDLNLDQLPEFWLDYLVNYIVKNSSGVLQHCEKGALCLNRRILFRTFKFLCTYILRKSLAEWERTSLEL